MDLKTLKVISAVFIALTVVMAGLFVFEYSGLSSERTSYNALQTSYNTQQEPVVLKNAYAHWDYIAIENSSLLQTQYMNNATLHWIGGPLTGTYKGISNITSTWNKFFGLWSAVWFYAESPPVITISGNIVNVNATVQFIVQSSANASQFRYINVSYDITYFNTGFDFKNGMPQYVIYNEVFHIIGSNAINKL